jgi:type I protein arginine methyltransferase
VDIQTITAEELTFAAPFKVHFKRADYCHALVAWFDIEFSHCHKPVRFSTGPAAKYTHWKQTFFYLEDVLCADVGETLSGELRCRPNARNRRDLDIELDYAFDGKIMQSRRTQSYRLR